MLLDPDPHSQYGSRSCAQSVKWKRIHADRIHNTSYQYLGIGGNQGGEMRDSGQRWEVCRVWDLQGPDTDKIQIFLQLLCSVSDPDSIRSVDPDPGGQNRKKVKQISCFEAARCSFLRSEGFFCSLYVFYGGLGISKLQNNITFFLL